MMAMASGQPDCSVGMAAARELRWRQRRRGRRCARGLRRGNTRRPRSRNATVFIAAVTSCVLLPQLMPRHCKMKNADDHARRRWTWTCPASGGNQRAAVFGDDDGDGGGGAASREPVAPADDEAGVIADGAAREIVLAAAARNRGAEFGQRRRADKRVESADDPNAEEEINVGEPLRDIAGRAHDARGDSVADGGGDAEPHAENLQQAAATERAATCGACSAGACWRDREWWWTRRMC